jgi:hypothetical protein
MRFEEEGRQIQRSPVAKAGRKDDRGNTPKRLPWLKKY